MIPVTKCFLPPLQEYVQILDRAYSTGWITNRGSLVLELEDRIKTQFGLSNMVAMTNGTIPLQIAIRLLAGEGEVITTPYSYIATTSSILWEKAIPVFVDIEPEYYTIDPSLIESAVTARTKCILATHVYGNPCDVERIERIAKKHDLAVIYDGAHAFGVEFKKRPLLAYGDVSTCSFHATKVFHTAEGGAFFTSNSALARRAFEAHNFGHIDQLNINSIGINGKMSELSAAMGLAVLPYWQRILDRRKLLFECYAQNLSRDRLRLITLRPHTTWNYSYCPVLFSDESTRDQVELTLNNSGVFPRRYFSPSLARLNFVAKGISTPIADSVSSRVLCLPLYHDLDISKVELICNMINDALR